jgi:tetratricopeptide (TPR) repeat protein
VFDHAKRAVSTFPVADGVYYGVDYRSRPAADADLSWYRNIPVPTSYMATGTQGDFFGGYDHSAEAGFVHWADHRISPGKKQWTWGNSEFGYAWDRELTDADGPYVELMAGVYTDNQPDFSFLMPYETKTFSQYWYPIQRIGPAHAANLDGAVSLTARDGVARVGVAVTTQRSSATVRLMAGEEVLWQLTTDLAPARPLVVEGVPVPRGVEATGLSLSVWASGHELVSYRLAHLEAGEAPQPALEPPLPVDISSNEELYLTGLHLAQYHHATRHAEDYWEEALRRQPEDARSHTAMGWSCLHRGEFRVAIDHFERAIATLTRLNPNPRDGEPLYGLGLALRYANRLDEADAALAKAAWSEAWHRPAQFIRAQLAARRGQLGAAIRLLDDVVGGDRNQFAARSLRAAICRHLGRLAEARADISAVLCVDPLDAIALDQRRRLATDGEWVGKGHDSVEPPVEGPLPCDVQKALDVVHDYSAAGLLSEAIDVLQRQLPEDSTGSVHPMVRYTLAWLQLRAGDPEVAAEFRRAADMPRDYCFPARLEEIEILETAMAKQPEDARAPYYLGNLLYDRRRYEDAIAAWRRAAQLDPAFSTVHRNLGLAEFNVLRRPEQALACYHKAFAADPSDARVLYELDQLRRRCGETPRARLLLLDQHRQLVGERDDLTVEYVTLLNLLGRYEEALGVLKARRFHPWEGGEGLVSGQWVLANLGLAQVALDTSDPARAVECLEAALVRPQNLGEGKHLLTPENEIQYRLGLALRTAGRQSEAQGWLRSAATPQGDTRVPLGEPAYWQAEAFRALGDESAATGLLEKLLWSAHQRAHQPQTIDYFATSLPTFLVFEDDLDHRNRVECRYLEALALVGLTRRDAAISLLREILDLDQAHIGARWHLRLLGAETGQE